MIKFLTLRQFICPLSLFLKEIPFASLTNAIDVKIERVFQPIKSVSANQKAWPVVIPLEVSLVCSLRRPSPKGSDVTGSDVSHVTGSDVSHRNLKYVMRMRNWKCSISALVGSFWPEVTMSRDRKRTWPEVCSAHAPIFPAFFFLVVGGGLKSLK